MRNSVFCENETRKQVSVQKGRRRFVTFATKYTKMIPMKSGFSAPSAGSGDTKLATTLLAWVCLTAIIVESLADPTWVR
jgi:hypothetical protein